ncbi:hypothetical protein LDENG_00037310 [Lucifuga dentata]|nr:hypothetical protein LDENG_00037310 [Lucifuga dentata]
MMDKKSANGIQSKASESGVQRKQLPYSVETPYGFHLDLDFLKYVDDIEKGNTIKRVHIQRRIKGPSKFSTLPRNFSLPGHGVRPVLKEKDSTWSGTSTLGPKPKSRVTEVQQIFDFRPSDGGTSSQSTKGTISQVAGYVSAKPREELGTGARGLEEMSAGIQARPNLLRASSMPITLQQRKGSDSSSPDRSLGTPENGSSESMFRASPDIVERRSVPQERVGLHQQITVALKRVRELEEQVKTIPELKAQICSLREERGQLLLQLQAKAQSQASISSPVPVSSTTAQLTTQPQGQRPSGEFHSPLLTPPLEASDSVLTKPVTGQEKHSVTEISRVLQTERESVTSSLAHGKIDGSSELERQAQPSEKSDIQKTALINPSANAAEKLSQDVKHVDLLSNIQLGNAKEGKPEHFSAHSDEDLSVQKLHEKLAILETKLAKATSDLERANSLLKEQIEENKVKEERILELSEGIKVEVCTAETHDRPRRDSTDRGTETEKLDFAHQETETELPGTIDQGTDTDKICVEVCVPRERAGSIDQGTETEKVDTHVEVAAVDLPRPRANSMERSTETERVTTQDQTTETPVAERVNQVTETEEDSVTDHPMRPWTSSVDQGTETERVDTVDRVTETEVAQRTDQETETEVVRRQDNNPARNVESENQVTVEHIHTVVSERPEDKKENEMSQIDTGDSESVVRTEVIKDGTAAFTETVVKETLVSDVAAQDERRTTELAATGENKDTESKIEESTARSDSDTKDIILPKSGVTEIVETEQEVQEIVEKKQKADSEVVCVTIKETVVTDTVVVAAENSTVKTVAPVRPQRGRKSVTEQSKISSPQLQASLVRPHRGSRETQAQQSQPQTKTQPQTQGPPQPQTQAGGESSEAQIQMSEPEIKDQGKTLSQVEDHSLAQSSPQVPVDGQSHPQVQRQTESQSPSPGPGEAQIQPQIFQAQSQSPTSAALDLKEVPVPQRGSSVSQPACHGLTESQVRSTRQGSTEVKPQSQGSCRSSNESQPPRRDSTESQPRRRGSSEAAQRRGSSEVQASRRDTGEARRGSSESPTSPAALGQVVTRITGLLGEQWAQLGSSSGAQQTASQQESPSAQKQMAGKKATATKGASAKPVGKVVPAATTGKPAGKPGPSKMSSIQSQLVSSLSVLSAFYSPGQKAAAASKQQEQGLKSIMKKNGTASKQGNKETKKNLKFVGVNGGYETTSSEESSGDEKVRGETEEADSSEPEEEKEEQTPAAEKPEEGAETQGRDTEALPEGGGAVAVETEGEGGLLDLEGSQEVQDEGEQVDKGFIDACLYVKDRMGEVSSPDKEMRQVLVVLYQEWFRVSSQKDSQADTVRLYLRQVGMTTPTLLPYVVNLTDGNGNMALHYSVSHSNFAVVKLLLDTGLCETDNVNKAGYTPVMLAALTAAESPEELEVALQLLKLGDVNSRSRQAGQTALMLAVSHGRVAMVKLLLSCGADVNAQDREGSTALMCASEHGHTHIARLLLETGLCDSTLTDKNGQTALLVAEGASHQDIVDLLKAHAEARAADPTSATDL